MSLKQTSRCFLLFYLLLILLPNPIVAQDAKTFLYRITGNGMEMPSFLFGTIHLQDSRLFNFQDSLYSYLEQCNTFAMEINPDSITQVLMDNQMKGGKKVLLKDRVSKPSFEKIKKQFQYMCTEAIETLSLGELIYYVRAYYSKYDVREKMPTFMDMYLMGIASDLGKDVEGLERVEDQFNLFEKLLEGKEPEEVLAGMADKRKEGDALVKTYLNNDLKGVTKFISLLPPDIEAMLLSDRNLVMVSGMQKLMEKGSLFTAVGAAHLPGKDGIIQLLRNKGYTVTPELSAARTHARNYERPANASELAWKTRVVEKDGYSILMPGDPAKSEIPGSGADMYSFINWKTNEYYFSLHTAVNAEITEDNRDSILNGMLDASVKNMKGNIVSPKKETVQGGLKGYEVTANAIDKLYYRICLLNNGNDMYLLMKGAQKVDMVNDENAARFFGSLKILPKKLAEMKPFTNTDLGFTINFPGKPSETIEDEKDSEAINANYFAKRGSAEFLVMVSSCNAGYSYTNDTLTLGRVRENMLDKADTLFTEKKGIFQAGYPMWDFSGNLKSGPKLLFKYVQRGNRLYYIWMSAPKTTDITAIAEEYFNSFRLLPYKDPVINMVIKDSIHFATTNGEVNYQQNYNGEDSSAFMVYHKPLASTMEVSYAEINKRAWAESDSAFLRQLMVNEHKLKDEDILNESFFTHDGLPGFEMIFKTKSSHQVRRQRLLKKGNMVYKMQMPIEPSASNLSSVQTMFNSVKIERQHPGFDISTNSAEKLFSVLDTASMETFKDIVYDFDDLPFSRKDLPFLLKKGAQHQVMDTISYPSLESAIWQQVENLADSTDIPLLAQTWKTIKPDTNSTAGSYLLGVLAEIGTNKALTTLKQLFFPDFEKEPSTYRIFNPLATNPKTAQIVFPDWFSLLSDQRYAYGVLHLYNTAKDSNFTIPFVPADFEDSVIGVANSFLQKTDQEDYEFYHEELVTTLEKFRSQKANNMLSQLAAREKVDRYLRYEAALALLRNGEEPEKLLEQLAALPELRSSMLYDLEKMDKMVLFPAKYLTQPAMAEAYLYDSFEDETPDIVEAIGTRTAKYEGDQYLFYLYKVGYTWEGKTEYYLAVSGPFELTGKDYKPALENTYIIGTLEDDFDKRRIDKQLAAYLKGFEKVPEIEVIRD